MRTGIGGRNTSGTRTLTSTSIKTSEDFILPVTGQSTQEPEAISPTAVSVLLNLEMATEKGEDLEDVLLLYDSTHLSNFAANFCKIADFYGLICAQLALDQSQLTDDLLRDADGRYFKLIGIDASVLLQLPVQLTKNEIEILKSAVETGGANLFLSKIVADENTSAASIIELTDRAIQGVLGLKESHYNWIVSSDAPEVTMEFTGQEITSQSTLVQSELNILQVDSDSTTTLISSIADNGVANPVFVQSRMGAGVIYVDAGEPAPSLDRASLREIYYDPSNFSQIVPLMLTMRAALGEEAWHNNQDFANLTIDGPVLREPFHNLSFIGLLREMLAHNFHTTIAFIPANWQETQSQVVSLFQKYPQRFSLVQLGKDHDGEEYAAQTDSEQAWDIKEGMSRMGMLNYRTGLGSDPVMIFPSDIPPGPILGLLKEQNFLATVNAQDVPLNTARPAGWDYGMSPVIMDYGNFPVLTRRQPGAYQPFQPDIQPFIFDLFLDKPALLYSHPYEDGLFANGIASFNPVADRINNLSARVDWQSLGNILRHLYLEKTNDDGSLDVRMFTNHLILTNDSQDGRTYHISKQETMKVPITGVTLNGMDYPSRLEGDKFFMDVYIPSGDTVEILIDY